ncbi:MAG: hypothetical protein A2W25_10545 [candidate division Zixibacteria bacterium RBG_16_53_22]|nr:MAG: hypothetical protein A2W25_10545 [candidate division Zixibacteria bacterium RBG_16_53_22]
MVELLRTKLYIPRRRTNIVPRPHLVERINSSLEKKLTLISAPAGFGKTTLLSEWLSKCPRRVTWLFLDEGDNDPTQFWAYFMASLQGLHADLGSRAFVQIQSQQPPPIKSILTELINDLAAFSEPFASVLDDYHFIDAQSIHEAMSFLIDHLPANVHLVITTREDPDLPLARLRARDHLTEIRAMDLRFTQEESEAFLRGVMGLELSRQEVTALEERTEGWAVGLQLAGLSMQSQTDTKSFIADFSGSHRYILDYLSDEVLRQQAEDVRTFLIQTAILDRLNGPLCDALTGRTDSGKLLEYLEAANLFVIPLDGDRRWYRYHQLFADLLRNQLTRSQPDSIAELHRKASQWLEANGDIQAAIDHALEASDVAWAVRLIGQHAMSRLYKGEVAMVIGWFDRLPEAIFQTDPMLCIYKAWALALMQRGRRMEEAEQVLKTAELVLDQVQAGEEVRKLAAGHAASIRAYLLPTPSREGKETEVLIALCEEARRLLPEDELAIHSVIALKIGFGFLMIADLEAARSAYQHALEAGLAGGNYYSAVYGPINLVLIALVSGHLREALDLCDSNINQFNQIIAGQYFPPIGALYVLKGSLYLESDRLAEAERVLTEGLDLIRWTGESIAHRRGYAALARLRAIQEDQLAMFEAVKTLEESWPEGTRYAQALRHRLSLRHWPDDPQGIEEAQAWLEQSGIKFDELAVIKGIDSISVAYMESYLNAAHVLARLAIGKPGSYPFESVQACLERQENFAEAHGFASWVVEIGTARTLLYLAEGKKREALDSLEAALTTAAGSGIFRMFVDECDPLKPLLEELKQRIKDEALKAYTSRLLEAMRCGPARPEEQEVHKELLSQRELEVMRSLADGLTYEEIGQQLYLSLNTVQFHVKNIYGKLLVNKRVQAIERARELHLI